MLSQHWQKKNKSNQTAIAREGASPILLILLQSDVKDVAVEAGEVITKLVDRNLEVGESFVRHGAVPLLTSLRHDKAAPETVQRWSVLALGYMRLSGAMTSKIGKR